MFVPGTAVNDVNNTGCFGEQGENPLIAMYTSFVSRGMQECNAHNSSNHGFNLVPTFSGFAKWKSSRGKAAEAEQQAQSIAYSLDDGNTWTTYDSRSAVILDPLVKYQDQIREFRYPGVFWQDPTGKWVALVCLVKMQKLLIYTSENLRE